MRERVAAYSGDDDAPSATASTSAQRVMLTFLRFSLRTHDTIERSTDFEWESTIGVYHRTANQQSRYRASSPTSKG
jgi:hypothetical protein